MTTRRTQFPLLLARTLAVIAGIYLSAGAALAQSEVDPHLQADPPAVSRYRKIRRVFQVTADPTSKPLPLPTMVQEEPLVVTPSAAAAATSPSPEDLAKKQARLREQQRLDAENDRRHEILVGIGKIATFILIVAIGVFAASDVARQIRKARLMAAIPQDEGENQWEP